MENIGNIPEASFMVVYSIQKWESEDTFDLETEYIPFSFMEYGVNSYGEALKCYYEYLNNDNIYNVHLTKILFSTDF